MDLRTVPEFVAAARRKLSREVWDYAFGGSETEATLRRNRWALAAITFRARVLAEITNLDTGTTFLGHPLKVPFMFAPVGTVALFDPDAIAISCRIAHRHGTVAWFSSTSLLNLEQTAAAAPGPLVFQLYPQGGRDWIEGIVRRVEAAGYAAICMTADTAVYGRRERDLHNRFYPSAVPLTIEGIPNAGTGFGGGSFTWKEVDWLRSVTKLPLILKGVMTAEDAILAAEHGFQAVCVSNHGARQLDYLPSTIEVLPEIVAAVGNRVEVVIDGGFLRGTDIVKALCLKARAVLLGKSTVLGLAAGGEAGLEGLVQIQTEEIRTAMALLGARTVADLSPDYLRVPRFDAMTEPVVPALRSEQDYLLR